MESHWIFSPLAMVAISVAFGIFFENFRKSSAAWNYSKIVNGCSNLMYCFANITFLIYTIYLLSIDKLLLNHIEASPVNTTLFATRLMDDNISDYKYRWEIVFKIFYLSKIFEYKDLILVFMMHEIEIHDHFRLHHYTTLSLAYTFLEYIPFHGVIFLYCNVFIHSMLYLWHSGFLGKKYKNKGESLFGRIIRIQGHIQLIVPFVVCLVSCTCYYQTQFEYKYLWTMFCYALYFVLFRKQLRDERKFQSSESLHSDKKK